MAQQGPYGYYLDQDGNVVNADGHRMVQQRGPNAARRGGVNPNQGNQDQQQQQQQDQQQVPAPGDGNPILAPAQRFQLPFFEPYVEQPQRRRGRQDQQAIDNHRGSHDSNIPTVVLTEPLPDWEPIATEVAENQGYWMKAPIVDRVFERQPIFCKLIASIDANRFNLWPDTTDATLTGSVPMGYMYAAVVGYAAYHGIDIDSATGIASLAYQLFVPVPGAAQLITEAEQTTALRFATMGLLTNATAQISRVIPEAVGNFDNAIAEPPAANGAAGPIPLIDAPVDTASYLYLTPIAATNAGLGQLDHYPIGVTRGEALPNEYVGRVIRYFAKHIPDVRQKLLSLLVTVVIALAKRGEVTTDKLANIRREVNKGANIDVNLTLSQIKSTYQVMGHFVTKDNAQRYFKHIEAIATGQDALRIRIIAQQAAQSGLTQIIAIRNALVNFPQFPWVELAEMWPNQWAAVKTTLRAIENNPFHGFSQDLGLTKSTLYRDVAYVAKELLIRMLGAGTLRQYAGFKRTPMNQDQVERMIESFIQYHEAPKIGPIAPATITETAAVLALARASTSLATEYS